jgi:hypothetical protein
MKSKFDLVICFIGSAACNPILSLILEQYYDPRFFFSKWEQVLLDKVLEQQEQLGAEKRSILILVDDVIMGSKDQDQLAHLAMRGRHFGISIMMCAVSYTTLPKKARRSLDALLCFSMPMQGDMKVMTWEYASKNSMAEHVLRNLGEHECLVLETLQKKQQLFIWKADLLSACQKASRAPGILRTQPDVATLPARCRPARRTKTFDSSESTKFREGENDCGVRLRVV